MLLLPPYAGIESILSRLSKTTPANADIIPLLDSAASFEPKQITVQNLLAAAGGGGGGDWDHFLIKTANEDKTSDTSGGYDNTLKFTADASSTYVVEVVMMWQQVTTVPDFKYCIGCDDVLSGAYRYVNYSNYNTFPINTFWTLAGGNLTRYMTHLIGIVDVDTTGGTLGLKWSQNLSSTNATRVMKGSLLKAKKAA